MTWFTDMLQDSRHAARTLAKSPGFTLVASLTLALGLGLATVQFSLIKAIFLPDLQMERGERVMALDLGDKRGRTINLKGDAFLGLRENQRSFAGLTGYAGSEGRVNGEGFDARVYRGAGVTAGFFDTLGVHPAMGRTVRAEDEAAGAERAVWLGHQVWKGDFGSDPAIIGRVLQVNGEPGRIAGVMPERFGFPNNMQIWTNLRIDEIRGADFSVVCRLRDGASVGSTQAELAVLSPRLAELGILTDDRFNRLALSPLVQNGNAAIMLLAMLGIVGGVLALACVNVANLWFARAVRQGRALAVRVALGASRWRIIRQMLAESTVLACVGAAGGLVFATWGIALLRRRIMLDPDLPYWLRIDLDWRVFSATAAVTLLAGIVSGMAPALRAARTQPSAMLKETGGGLAGLRLSWMNRSLVTLQVGLACILLVVTGLLVDGLRRMGGDSAGRLESATLVAHVTIDDQMPQYADAGARRLMVDELLAQVRGLPGIEAATAAEKKPVNMTVRSYVESEGDGGEDGKNRFESNLDTVVPGYFSDMGIAVRGGRDFNRNDASGGDPVAVVNDSFAGRLWPGEPALGKRFRDARSKDEDSPWLTVVGVVADTRQTGLGNRNEVAASYYLPAAQAGLSRFYLLARGKGDPHALAGPIREIARRLAPAVPVDVFRTIEELIDEELSAPRAFGALAFSFGIGALLLAAVGIFSVTAFSVERRSREFGVRMALGARPGDVVALVFRQSGWQLGIGLGGGFAVGGAIAFILLRSMNGLLPAATTVPYGTIAAAVMLSLAVALLIPARRAANVDPMAALRAE